VSSRSRIFGSKRDRVVDDELFDEEFMRQLELLQVIARRLMRGRQRAERKTRKVGSGLEFADHREYSPGDDIRNVDWNVLVRLNQTLVRQYEEDEDLPLRLIVDVSESMAARGGHKLRLGKRIAAALGYVGLAGLDRVGVIAMSGSEYDRLPALRGKGRIFKMLDFLRRTPTGGDTDLRATCRRVAAESRPPGVSVLISDFYDLEGAFEGLNLLRFQKHEVVCIQVLDPIEADPTRSLVRGDVTLVDVEGGRTRDLTLSPEVLEKFAAAHEAFCKKLESQCRSRGIPYFRAYIDDDFEELVLRVFRKGGVLR
jgi:uncharacterized protein (DUF58 family)